MLVGKWFVCSEWFGLSWMYAIQLARVMQADIMKIDVNLFLLLGRMTTWTAL